MHICTREELREEPVADCQRGLVLDLLIDIALNMERLDGLAPSHYVFASCLVDK